MTVTRSVESSLIAEELLVVRTHTAVTARDNGQPCVAPGAGVSEQDLDPELWHITVLLFEVNWSSLEIPESLAYHGTEPGQRERCYFDSRVSESGNGVRGNGSPAQGRAKLN